MKKYFSFFGILVSVLSFTQCAFLNSLVKENRELIKQLKDSDLQGHTVTWLIFADESNALKSAAYKKAARYYQEKSSQAGFNDKLQILVVSEGIEKAIKEKVKEAGFDADCFPLRWNGDIKNKYNPENKKNYSVFFDKKGRRLLCLTEDWFFENYEGLKDYAIEAAGLQNVSDLKNPINLLNAFNKLKNDEILDFVSSALTFTVKDLFYKFVAE
ncbi:hypothetical protein [Treponema pedis]|uniref:Lipoprotein n=1 Tax=Treponema pedis TaxID=409322 RepID=A0A7S6WP85_9SPIR|nr:hypothetical protein [Treponema pedis]QOW60798.1 hypothetical protein IFE08_13600 [Treponema pedis]